MNKVRFRSALTVAFAMIMSASNAQELLLRFPMESTDDGEGRLYSREGGAVVAVPGKVGKALRFKGEAVLALPFNLDHQIYSQVTVTAWVKQEDGASGSRTVFHSGSTGGLTMAVNGGTLVMRTGGPGVSYSGGKVPNGEWSFIAAVLDTSAGIARLYQNYGEPTIRDDLDIDTKEPRKLVDPDDSEAVKKPYVFLGGNDFRTFYGTSRELVIDDVRVYAGLLNGQQIAAIRDGTDELVAHEGQTIGETEKNEPGAIADRSPPDAAATGPDVARSAPDAPRRTVGELSEAIGQPDIGRPAGAPDLTRNNQSHASRNEPGSRADAEAGEALEASRRRSRDVAQSAETGTDDSIDQQQGLEGTGKPRPVGEPKFSGVTGYTSGSQSIVDLETEFLRRIAWEEQTNRACYVLLNAQYYIRPVDRSDHPEAAFWFRCATTALQSPNPENIGNGVDYAIGRLELCSTSQDNKGMKGLTAYSDRLNPDGSATYVPGHSETASKPNCSEWHRAVLCPTDHYATGVVIHHKQYHAGYARGRYIVGMQLVCRAVGVN